MTGATYDYGTCYNRPMPREKIGSSAIEAVEYDAARQRLDVELTNRRVYRYFDVPPEVYHAFMAADSKGRFYNDEIRDDYDYARLR
jgi:KTSC domain